MKNRKGFTLVELMSVIVVLAIIIAIAVPTYNKIRLSIDKKNYENKIKLIEVAAAKYAEDTHYETIFVDDLIKNGFIEADEDGFIKNLDGEIINCNVIRIRNENGIYYADFLEDNIYGKKDTCDRNAANAHNKIVTIDIYEDNNEKLTDGKYYKWWTNKNVVLKVNINGDYNSIKWYRGNLTNEEADDERKTEKKVITETQLREKYIVDVTLKDGKNYKAEAIVNIDKLKPGFYDNNGKIKSNKWMAEYNYVAKAYDNESGLKGFYKAGSLNEACSTEDKDKYEMKSIKIEKNGEYKICLMDNVGNINADTINIQNIDDTVMECYFDVSGSKKNTASQWYTSDVTLTLKPKLVGLSGVSLGINDKNTAVYDKEFTYAEKDNAYISKTVSSNTNSSGATYYGFIKNKVGKTNSCNTKVYVEKSITAPVYNSSTSTSSYNSITASFTTGSAPSGIAETTCHLTDASGNVSSNGTLNSNGSCTFSVTATSANTTYYFKKCITSKAGNKTCSAVSSKTNVGYCTSGNVTYRDGSTCTNVCGGGTYNQIAYSMMDNKTLCPNQNLNSGGSSCGGVTYKDGTTCSNICGGTYNQIAYSKIDSTTRCTSYDKTSGGSACGGKKEFSRTTCTATCPTACGQKASTQYGTQTINYVSTLDNNHSCGATPNVSCSKSCAKTADCCTDLTRFTGQTLVQDGAMCNKEGQSIVFAYTTSAKRNLTNASRIEYSFKLGTSENQYDIGVECTFFISDNSNPIGYPANTWTITSYSRTLGSGSKSSSQTGSYTIPAAAKTTNMYIHGGVKATSTACDKLNSDGKAKCIIEYLRIC